MSKSTQQTTPTTDPAALAQQKLLERQRANARRNLLKRRRAKSHQ